MVPDRHCNPMIEPHVHMGPEKIGGWNTEVSKSNLFGGILSLQVPKIRSFEEMSIEITISLGGFFRHLSLTVLN